MSAVKKKGSPKARNRSARLAAVQALYQMAQNEQRGDSVVKEFKALRFGEKIDEHDYVTPDPDLFDRIVTGLEGDQDQIDEIISSSLSQSGSFSRLSLLVKMILRAGAFELKSHHDIAGGIIINDYVTIAQAFFTEKEPGLVNAVLDKISGVLREHE